MLSLPMTPTWPVIKEKDVRQYDRVTRRNVRNRNYIRCECHNTGMDGESANLCQGRCIGQISLNMLEDITEIIGKVNWAI